MEFSLQCGSWIGRIRRSSIEDMEDLKAIEVPRIVHDFDEIPYSTYIFYTEHSYIKFHFASPKNMCRNWSPESMGTKKVPYMKSFKSLKLRRKEL